MTPYALCLILLHLQVEERVLELKEAWQTFTFEGLAEEEGEPVLSVLRGFSAPVTNAPDASSCCLCLMPYALCLLCSRCCAASRRR